MLNLLLNHSPPFVVGEFALAVSLGMFSAALVQAVRERYAIRLPARIRDRFTH
jgi:hypothetical protein